MLSHNLDAGCHGDSLQQLGRVAGLLSGAGNAEPALVDPGIALLCLAAADELRALGVQPSRVVIGADQVGEALDAALAGLAMLPEQIFAATPVLEAAAYTRAARALLTESI